MVTVVGTYQNGHVKLDQAYLSDVPVKVIVTFLEKVEPASTKRLTLEDFSFSKSRKALEGYTGSFTDALIEERREGL